MRSPFWKCYLLCWTPFCTTWIKQINPIAFHFFVPFYSSLMVGTDVAAVVRAATGSFGRREIVLGADHRGKERNRARMPPPPVVVCPRCQAHAQHARPRVGAQAGRKRQSSWNARACSPPTRRPCQVEQLWPASAGASLPLCPSAHGRPQGKGCDHRGTSGPSGLCWKTDPMWRWVGGCCCYSQKKKELAALGSCFCASALFGFVCLLKSLMSNLRNSSSHRR